MKNKITKPIELIMEFITENPGCRFDEICAAMPQLAAKTVKNYVANLRGSGYVRWEREGSGNCAKTRNWVADGADDAIREYKEKFAAARAAEERAKEAAKAEPKHDDIDEDEAEAMVGRALSDGEYRPMSEIRYRTGLSSKLANYILAKMYYRNQIVREARGSGGYTYALNRKAPKFVEVSPGVMVAETPTGRIVKHTSNWRPGRGLSLHGQLGGVQSGLNRIVSGHL